jgi:hypothetical protein
MSNDMKLSKVERRQVQVAMGFGKYADDVREESPAREAHDEAQAALKAARRAAKRDDLAAAKRWTEIAKRMSEAAERLAKTPPPEPSWQEEEEMRDFLRERLRALGSDSQRLQAWQMRLEIWEEMAAEARRTGCPMPAPMPPKPRTWMDDLPEDLRKRLEAK